MLIPPKSGPAGPDAPNASEAPGVPKGPGTLHGTGAPLWPSLPPQLVETMLLHNGSITLWPLHRARLLASARALHYPLDAATLDVWLRAQVQNAMALLRDRGERGTARDVTRGAPHDKKTGLDPSDPARRAGAGPSHAARLRLLLAHDGELSLESFPQAATPGPVRLGVADERLGTSARLNADEFWLRHKTTHRPWFDAAAQWLRAHPSYFDLIFRNTAGELCEGSRCNLYVKNASGQWLTPPVACGLLPGVQRQALLDRGAVREARLTRGDLAGACAVRISNAVRGWLDARVD
ncbi:MAG: aminotransferase [Candidimonas sp.]|nr:MAG: aminotransferase [Candidimonas sp.]